MSAIAIITARGGSKRIPKKNIKDFCGKPIIAYSIEAATESNLFDEVMVSTDSEEIADVSMRYGAKVPFYRSAQTSNDYATTEDVLREVIEKYHELKQVFTHVCCIYPTAPFVTPDKLQEGYHVLIEKTADLVFPVVEFPVPPQWGLTLKESAEVVFNMPEMTIVRSQDIEPTYYDAGQFYWYNIEYFNKKADQIRKYAIPIKATEAQDIDTMVDWKIAEMKYLLMQNETEGEE